jgi:hypothetical protein
MAEARAALVAVLEVWTVESAEAIAAVSPASSNAI